MEENYWDKFTRTGSVTDYLYYKGMDICRQVMERYQANDPAAGANALAAGANVSATGANDIGRTGGRDSESYYGDRHGASGIAHR